MAKGITVTPIGYAKNKVKRPQQGGWKNVISTIELDRKYMKGLKGIKDYSHLLIIFHMNLAKHYELTHVPQGKVGVVPEVGVFACRCPARPNPIGITTAKLLSVSANKIKVKGLDVLDGTPIVDIKPYTPNYDSVKNARVPAWVSKLDY